MRPRGTIYKQGDPSTGEIYLSLSISKRIFYHFMRGVGIGLVCVSLLMIYFSYAPIVREELRFAVSSPTDYSSIIAHADSISDIQNEASRLGLDPSFSIVIPKIDAKANIYANVDTSNANEYTDVLTRGVAHAKGTYFPGQGKSVFLFAHSTSSPLTVAQYNAVFYLLSKLEAGDSIYIYFADKKYEYTVTSTDTRHPDDTYYLDSHEEYVGERLILMTCTPPGTTWKRLFIIAEPRH